MGILYNILVSVVITAFTFAGAVKYVPLSWIEPESQNFGTTLTTIAGSDTLSSSRTTINNNFTALNETKIDFSTTTLPLLTTLSGLTITGVLASSTWSGTPIGVHKGGTGTTTLSSNQVLLGNGTSGFKIVSGWGTSGQFLTSGGAGNVPTWTTSAIDTSIGYNWTANHIFSSFNAALASTSNASTTNLTVTGSTNTQAISATTISASGNVTSNAHALPEILLQNNTPYTTTQTSTTTVLSLTLPANTMGTNNTLDIYGLCSLVRGGGATVESCDISFGNGSATTSIAYMSNDNLPSPYNDPYGEFRVKIINQNSQTSQISTAFGQTFRSMNATIIYMSTSTISSYDSSGKLFISFGGLGAASNPAGWKGVSVTKY